MRSIVRGIALGVAVVVLVFGAVGSVRWAKRSGVGARVLANAMILGLGMGVVVDPPQQGVEQAEENVDKTGGESGDPPA